MTSRRFDSREEPFIGSLRERIEQTKAENAKARASSPSPPRVEGPPSEEAQRAARKSRALALIGEGRRSGGLWPAVLLVGLLLVAGAIAVRSGLVTPPTIPRAVLPAPPAR
jgi:hypothetical protein